jgi:hypothetical protein
MTDPAFQKLPECDRCWFNAGSPYLCCSVHPTGMQSDRCPDFREDAAAAHQHREFLSLAWVTASEQGQWEPEGASYYGNELVINTEQRWNREQKLALLDWHPLFTGRCPSCEVTLLETAPPRLYWDCACGWRDDSV